MMEHQTKGKYQFLRLRQMGQRFASYQISTYAASASFFIITSMFPMLMLAFSLLSYLPWEADTAFVAGITRFLPDALLPFFLPLIQELQSGSAAKLSISILATVWTASKSIHYKNKLFLNATSTFVEVAFKLCALTGRTQQKKRHRMVSLF